MWLRLLLKQEYQTKPHARTRASIKTHAHTYNLRFSGRQRRRGFSVRGAYPTYANESSQTHPRARGLQLSHRSRRFGCLRARNKSLTPCRRRVRVRMQAKDASMMRQGAAPRKHLLSPGSSRLCYRTAHPRAASHLHIQFGSLRTIV